MSNFFGALGSDDDEPTKITTTKKGTAGTAAKGECLGLEFGILSVLYNRTWAYGQASI